MSKPTGAARVLGIVGDPVAQVLAPQIWTSLFKENGVDAVCVPMHVRPHNLNIFLKGIGTLCNLDGLIVTVPYKPIVLSWVDLPTERARQVGAVNVMRWERDGQTSGDIFDGVGLVNGLAARGQSVRDRRAMVIGCGGVGSAIAFALAESGVASLSLNDLDPRRAKLLAARLQASGYRAQVGLPVAAGFDLIVNGTPVGMNHGDPLPLDCTDLGAATIVCDAVMHPVETPLLKFAASRGCFVQPGTYLLEYQLLLMANFFGFEMSIDTPQVVGNYV